MALTIDQDVLRLQVAVDNALGVGSIERPCKLARKVQDRLQGKTALLLQKMTQVLAFNVGHGDEFHSVCVAEVVDAENVAVGDAAGKQQFLLESSHGLRVCGEFRAEQLESYNPVKLPIARLENQSHASLAQERLDPIAKTKVRPRLKRRNQSRSPQPRFAFIGLLLWRGWSGSDNACRSGKNVMLRLGRSLRGVPSSQSLSFRKSGQSSAAMNTVRLACVILSVTVCAIHEGCRSAPPSQGCPHYQPVPPKLQGLSSRKP